MATTEPPIKKKNAQTTEKERRDGAIMGVWTFNSFSLPYYLSFLLLFSRLTWPGNFIADRRRVGLQTNNSSIVSKRSVERLYSKPDEHQFLRHFVKKPQRRSPLINRGYWLRMRAVEHVVRSFLSEEVIDSRTKIPVKKVVVNLGCGLFVPPPPPPAKSGYPTVNRSTPSIRIEIIY